MNQNGVYCNPKANKKPRLGLGGLIFTLKNIKYKNINKHSHKGLSYVYDNVCVEYSRPNYDEMFPPPKKKHLEK